MELLLSKGADPKMKIHDSLYDTTNGFTPLHFILGGYGLAVARASSAQKIQGIKDLLAKGAGLGAKDATGATPLHLAAEWGDPEIVAALLEYGADPLAKDLHGRTPLARAKQFNDTPAIHKLHELLAAAEAGKTAPPR